MEDGAGGAISRSDTAKKGDVQYVPCEGSGDVDARPVAQRVETCAGQRVGPALVDFQPEISQRDAGQLVIYRQLRHSARGRNMSRVDRIRLRRIGLVSGCRKVGKSDQQNSANETEKGVVVMNKHGHQAFIKNDIYQRRKASPSDGIGLC